MKTAAIIVTILAMRIGVCLAEPIDARWKKCFSNLNREYEAMLDAAIEYSAFAKTTDTELIMLTPLHNLYPVAWEAEVSCKMPKLANLVDRNFSELVATGYGVKEQQCFNELFRLHGPVFRYSKLLRTYTWNWQTTVLNTIFKGYAALRYNNSDVRRPLPVADACYGANLSNFFTSNNISIV